MTEEVRTLDDVRKELDLIRTPVKIEDIVGEEIVIVGMRDWIGRFGKCYTLHLVRDGEPCYCVTSATVVTQKLSEVEDHFPLVCTIIKEAEYYDIV